MEFWALAARIALVLTLVYHQGTATETSIESKDITENVTNQNPDGFLNIKLNSEEKAASLSFVDGDDGVDSVLLPKEDAAGILEDGVDPLTSSVKEDSSGPDKTPDTGLTSVELSPAVEDNGDEDVAENEEDGVDPLTSAVKEDSTGSDKTPDTGLTSVELSHAVEDNGDEYEYEYLESDISSGKVISEVTVHSEVEEKSAEGEEKISEVEGRVAGDEDLASEERGRTTAEAEVKATDDEGDSLADKDNISTDLRQDTSKDVPIVKDSEEKLPRETDSIDKGDETSLPDMVLASVDTVFASDDKSILIKVPEESVIESSTADSSTGYDGVMVFNQKVYPGKICSETIEQASGDLEMPPEPWDPECKAWSWEVTVGDGYFADVTLKELNVNHETNEFMIIGPGSCVSDLWEDASNPIFTSVITSEKKFRMLQAETFSVLLVTNTLSGFKGGFKLSYERSAKVDTTPMPTTPAPTLPSPAENVTTEIRVYLEGKTAEEFSAISVEFRQVVAEMANIYCNENGIPMRINSTYEMVVLSLIRQCDLTWPDHYDCVQVNMSVAVILPTDYVGGFELTAEHLQDMWDTKADQPESGLANLGLEVYYEPDHRANLTLWLGVSLGVLTIFIFILIIVWRTEIFRDYSRMNGKRDSQFSHRSSTFSNDSDWFPETDHQLVPPYMDMYSEAGYVEYEPEFNGPVPASKYQKPVSMTVEPAVPAYNGPPPRYGPPTGLGFGGGVHFYGNTSRDFDNPAFVEEDEDGFNMEEEVNTGEGKYPIGWNANSTNNMSSC